MAITDYEQTDHAHLAGVTDVTEALSTNDDLDAELSKLLREHAREKPKSPYLLSLLTRRYCNPLIQKIVNYEVANEPRERFSDPQSNGNVVRTEQAAMAVTVLAANIGAAKDRHLFAAAGEVFTFYIYDAYREHLPEDAIAELGAEAVDNSVFFDRAVGYPDTYTT
jgi:hypothetical protein